MTNHLRRALLPALLLCSLLSATPQLSAQDAFVLEAADGQRWMKGNMHTHSLWSDGDDFPENLAKWYRDKGYQFLVFTDHNTLLQKERWLNLAKRKGSDKALQRLREQWPAEWIEIARRELELGNHGSLLSVAEKISSKLKAPNGGAYGKWLNETVGSLNLTHRDVPDALRDLGLPLLTTLLVWGIRRMLHPMLALSQAIAARAPEIGRAHV